MNGSLSSLHIIPQSCNYHLAGARILLITSTNIVIGISRAFVSIIRVALEACGFVVAICYLLRAFLAVWHVVVLILGKDQPLCRINITSITFDSLLQFEHPAVAVYTFRRFTGDRLFCLKRSIRCFAIPWLFIIIRLTRPLYLWVFFSRTCFY